MDQKEIFTKISEALLIDYSSVYYVDAVTNEYCWYSIDPKFHSLQIEPDGDDFFRNMSRDAEKVVYEEDKHIFQIDIQKDKLLKRLKNGDMQSLVYRLVIDGKPVYHSLRLIHDFKDEDEYFIFGVLNVDKEVREKQRAEQMEKERMIFSQISESLASQYDVIYYVNTENGNYIEIKDKEIYGNENIVENGQDFFADAQNNIMIVVHPEDQNRIKIALNRDHMISSLERRKQFITVYRLLLNGRIQYTRMNVLWARDRKHLIIGVENIDEEIEKEQEQMQALNNANEMARRDELTGAKNKNAYQELEAELQLRIGYDSNIQFGLVVCDLNNLKLINDSLGHKAGDEYIRSCFQLLCDIFAHSPVFRIGGDEFLVYLQDRDYQMRTELFARFRRRVLENLSSGEGPVAAAGLSIFDKYNDKTVADVFERADGEMYSDKRSLKEQVPGQDHKPDLPETEQIPAARKGRLNALYKAFSIVAEHGYVYLCDMRYDYSRWSKNVVDEFQLPSEYMYHAGSIWEEKIHPDDRDIYRCGIENIFRGETEEHDMKYHVLYGDGTYDICYCRGLVIRNQHGEPEYFGGVLRFERPLEDR